MSLSSRFSQLKALKATSSASTDAGRIVKRGIVSKTQSIKRSNVAQTKRGLSTASTKLSNVAKKPTKQALKVGGKVKFQGIFKLKLIQIVAQCVHLGKKGKKGRKFTKKGAPPSADDLDKDLGLCMFSNTFLFLFLLTSDSDMHKGGRGPNPIQEELDSQLDQYKSVSA